MVAKEGGTTFTFETSGIESAQIHLVPVLRGEGRRLFDHIGTKHIELKRTRVIESPGVTHLRFRVVK